MKFPLGAPLFDGYTAVIKDGYSEYHFPKCDRKECRVFIEQDDGLVTLKEFAPVSYYHRRKIRIDGLKNATLRIFAEDYCRDNIYVTLNTKSVDNNTYSDTFDAEYKKFGNETYLEVRNVTGMIMFAFPFPDKEYPGTIYNK